ANNKYCSEWKRGITAKNCGCLRAGSSHRYCTYKPTKPVALSLSPFLYLYKKTPVIGKRLKIASALNTLGNTWGISGTAYLNPQYSLITPPSEKILTNEPNHSTYKDHLMTRLSCTEKKLRSFAAYTISIPKPCLT